VKRVLAIKQSIPRSYCSRRRSSGRSWSCGVISWVSSSITTDRVYNVTWIIHCFNLWRKNRSNEIPIPIGSDQRASATKISRTQKGLPLLLKKRGSSPRPWTWMDLTLSDRRRKEKGFFITRKKPPPLFLPSFHYYPFCFSFYFFWYIMFSII